MNEAAFWNDQGITKYFADKPGDPRIVAFLKKYSKQPHARALDLGCGGGRHTELLAKEGFQTAATDVNPEMLKTTKKRMEASSLQADIREGSITHIPYDNELFDIVVTTGVLHQAMSTQEYDEAIRELARVMKNGAYVLLNVFTNKVWDDTYEVVSDDGFTVCTKEGLGMTLLPKETFVKMMSTHGLKLYDEQSEDVKMENTGPRAVYRAFFVKE